MKYLIATLAVPLALGAGPIIAGTETSATCEDRFQEVSENWAGVKSDLKEPEDVSVSTEGGDKEVTAENAQPTENWFGKPPEIETVEGYLQEAESAMDAGDNETCLEQLKNVQAAIAPEEQDDAAASEKKTASDD